jgi:hypothetical protein
MFNHHDVVVKASDLQPGDMMLEWISSGYEGLGVGIRGLVVCCEPSRFAKENTQITWICDGRLFTDAWHNTTAFKIMRVLNDR